MIGFMRKMNNTLFGFSEPFSAVIFGTSGGIGGAINQKICHDILSHDFQNLNAPNAPTNDYPHSGENELAAAVQAPESRFVDIGQNFDNQQSSNNNVAKLTVNPPLDCHVFGVNRRSPPPSSAIFTGLQADALNEGQLSQTRDIIGQNIKENGRPPVRLIFVGIGALQQLGQDGEADLSPEKTFSPEKTWRDLSGEAMARVFATNTIAPSLIAKHFLPLLPRSGRSVFAVLSARVGSISDNRLGGWYSYRASKAALNQIIKTASIELARTRPEAICLGLHPGTVDTTLSKPFQTNVARGKLFTPQMSASYLLEVIGNAAPVQSGSLLAWDGSVVPA